MPPTEASATRPPPVHGSTVRHRLVGLAAFALGALLLARGLPMVAGASWHEIGDVLRGLTVTELLLLAAIWLAGLCVHTIALSAALPGLSHRRAFFLNITGSAVSNVLPLGGGAGTAVNFWVTRAWGFRTAHFVRWAVVTNIWDVLSRLAVPVVAIVWLFATGAPTSPLWEAGLSASAILLLALVLTVAALRTKSWARTAGRVADRWCHLVRRPPPPGTTYAALAESAQGAVTELVATSWRALTLGKAGYAALQAVLLWACLHLVHVAAPAAVVFGIFALERVLSLAVLSPAATGIVELGMAGFLVALGADPAASGAGVVLYRIFVVGLEVPVGAVLLLGWFARRLRWASLRPGRLPAGPPVALPGTLETLRDRDQVP